MLDPFLLQLTCPWLILRLWIINIEIHLGPRLLLSNKNHLPILYIKLSPRTSFPYFLFLQLFLLLFCKLLYVLFGQLIVDHGSLNRVIILNIAWTFIIVFWHLGLLVNLINLLRFFVKVILLLCFHAISSFIAVNAWLPWEGVGGQVCVAKRVSIDLNAGGLRLPIPFLHAPRPLTLLALHNCNTAHLTHSELWYLWDF